MRNKLPTLHVALVVAVGLLIVDAKPVEARRCPAGFHRVGRRCVRNGRRTRVRPHARRRPCPAGYIRRGPSCVFKTCPAGYMRRGHTCVRRPTAHRRHVVRCPAGYYRNSFNRCVRFRGRVRNCAAGWRWSGYYKRCIRRVTHRACPAGTVWNGYRCRAWRTCPAGSYYSSYYKACRSRVAKCPYGYRYRSGWGCRRMCPVGWYFSGGTCHKSTTACPPGQHYDYSRRGCRAACRPGFYWSYRRNRCRPRRW